MVNSKGELIYSRERDEPPPQQLVSRKVSEGMMQMMQKVVTDGTAQRAALDFTNVVGKTGTSSGPKDVWFVGATGKYVGVVWLGNDDNRPMAHGNTGGQLAAPLWQSFMSVAHRDMNIPTLPGLQPHPVQVAEQQRIAQLKLTNPAAAAAELGDSKPQSPSMTEPARQALKRITSALRKAAGVAEPPPSGPAPGNGPADGPPRGNRAEGPSNRTFASETSGRDPRAAPAVP
jgi:penicillin-binding protein 1A